VFRAIAALLLSLFAITGSQTTPPSITIESVREPEGRLARARCPA
jgi:hypothetical protein